MTKRFLWAVFFLTTGLCVAAGGSLKAEENYSRNTYTPPAPPQQARVVEAINSSLEELSGKMSLIEKKQDQILSQLDTIKQELDVIKVRATLKG